MLAPNELPATFDLRGALLDFYIADSWENGVVPIESLSQDRRTLRGNFVLLGAREYELKNDAYRVIPGSGLGILADEERSTYSSPVKLSTLPAEMRKLATEGELLIVGKANARAPVHRPERMDYVGVRRVTPEGDPSAEDVMRATRDAGFGDEVKRRIILGTYALSAGYYDAYYGSAQKVRTLIQRDFDAAFAQADVLVSPTAPTTAFRFGEKLDDPLAMYLNDVATIPANLAGVPGISVPAGLAPEDGLPVGIQFLAPAREDARLYNVGGALEALLVDQWGGPLIAQAPDLSTHELMATEEGVV